MKTMNEEPTGYMPIPTAEQLADALANVRCFHDLSAELIAPELLRNLLAAMLGDVVSAQPDQHQRILAALADNSGKPNLSAGCKVVPVELLELLREMVDLHDRRGTVLTVHMEQLRAILEAKDE